MPVNTIILISPPIILIASVITAYLLVPEIDPVLLYTPDVPTARYVLPLEICDENGYPSVIEAFHHMECLQLSSTTGHFTYNIRYPSIDLKVIDGITLFTKNYIGASSSLIDPYTGAFSFSWPSSCYSEGNSVHVFSFNGVREICMDSVLNEDDQLIVDWFKSWAENSPEWMQALFVEPYSLGYTYRKPLCIKIVYFTYQCYAVAPDGVGCDGPIYDITRLIPRFDEPILYCTADAVDKSLFELCEYGTYPRLKVIELLTSIWGFGGHMTVPDLCGTFYASMVHPLNGFPSQDIVAICLDGTTASYRNIDPGDILDGSDGSDNQNPALLRLIIFGVCAATLTLCTYIGYAYLG